MLAAAAGSVQVLQASPAGELCSEEGEFKGFRRPDVVMENEGMNSGIIQT